MSSNVFDCYNESSKDSKSALQTFVQCTSVKINDEMLEDSEIEICGQYYYKNVFLEEADVLIRIVRKNWFYLQSAILNETTISSSELKQIRETINKCLKLIIHSLKYCESNVLKQGYITSSNNAMKTLLPLILPTSEIEKEIYLKLTSPSCNKEKCPIYQYFHAYQDIQFHLLLFYHISGRSEDLKSRITFIMKDLLSLSENGHKRNNHSAYVCECNKNLWLIIQLLCEQAFGEDSFWQIFNEVVENCSSEYILWLLQDVATLQAYDSSGKYIGAMNVRIKPNFPLLETALKNIVAKLEFNSSLLPTLKCIEPVVCTIWFKWSKVEVYQILWDYFSKRLNSSARSNTNLTLNELVELVDTILWTAKDCQQDFELFLSMLCMHLTEHPFHWGKMKGRIYSQLGPNKLKDLNNGGIFNVLLLYLSLTKVNFDELSKKFLSFVDNLPVEKKQTQLIWSFYTAFVVRHLRENRDIEPITPPFIKMLEEASTDQKMFHLIKVFVKDFECILNFSTNLQLHQWLLINTWIHKYMTSCYYQDLITLLNVLLNAVERISTEHLWCEWEASFKDYAYPALKYSRSTPEISGTLAAKIALLSPSLLPEAFSFFNSDAVTPKVSASFLCVLLETYPNSFTMSPQQETLALQTWVKFCLLTRDSYEELTRSIIKLDIMPGFIKTALAPAKDPLCTFIDCIGSDVKQYVQSPTITRLCEIFFGQAERWITQYFTQPDNEAVVLRIYTCMGLAFFKIGPLLYNKHKSNCPFARLVSSLLLPTELMIGKPLNSYILQSVKKTWHLFFGATVKLNSPDDAFIERILREMIVRYVPHFATVDSPMLKCLDNEITAEVILDKMSNGFFKHPTKEAESNIFKCLRLINDFVQGTTSVALLKLVVKKSLSGLFEVIMFHSQRNMALTVVTNIASSPLYPQVKAELEDVLILVTEKHLAFNTPNYFQLLNNLSKIIPSGLKNATPRIKQQVSNVERMRGVGYDKTLRLNMERLEASLFKMP